jgi:membrane protein YdbS with pleckstrin-like domain
MTPERPRKKTKAKRIEERAVKLALLIGLGILLGVVVTLLVFEWFVIPDSPLAYAAAYAFLFLCALFFVVGAALVRIFYVCGITSLGFELIRAY